MLKKEASGPRNGAFVCMAMTAYLSQGEWIALIQRELLVNEAWIYSFRRDLGNEWIPNDSNLWDRAMDLAEERIHSGIFMGCRVSMTL